MGWNQQTIEAVWQRGRAVAGDDPARWRKDDCGAWIGRAEFGDRGSQYAWEIDHINPNGDDAIGNLRPLQWQNNVDKSDGRLKCNVTSRAKDNVATR
ncbi:MAG: HNH endonuclease signature motif containing protein [Chloroflexi bacterium]|nr:HNH endonuclease signature motif containing protein [Chloroflexota bacterium]